MSDTTLFIDGNRLIRDAFYAIPDFTDADGNHISGIYGAFYRIKELLSGGDKKAVKISFDSETDFFSDAILWQINRAKDLIEKSGLIKMGEEAIVTDELKSFVESTLLSLWC